MINQATKYALLSFPSVIFSSALVAGQPERPNIVLFLAEDLSSRCLQLYNPDGSGAATPHLAKWATEGIIFNNAFCNFPVSSPARSTLITGCYANRLGMSYHRSLSPQPLPEPIKMFPELLRRAGYYTANAMKTDYNCLLNGQVWDEISPDRYAWRHRTDQSRPFYQEITSMTTHESSLHFSVEALQRIKTRNNPDSIRLFPIHPDTPLMRYTYGTLYDRINEVDNEFDAVMNALADDSVLENTIVFFIGDNGGSLPGTKGYTNELGLHVPMIVYIPEKWRSHIGISVGSRVEGFVNFVDIAPTLLNLAGITIPDYSDGKVLLSGNLTTKELNKHTSALGFADRFDEQYSFTRTLRVRNYKYVRNYHPYQPRNLHNDYRHRMLALQELERLNMSGTLNRSQSYFFETLQPEELYDLTVDPFETNNLAPDKKFLSKLVKLRKRLNAELMKMGDHGWVPEAIWLTDSIGFFNDNNRLKRYSVLADLQLKTYTEARLGIANALISNDPVERYWGLTVCAWFGTTASEFYEKAGELQNDSSSLVGSKATLFLALAGVSDPVSAIKKLSAKACSDSESLQIKNDITVIKQLKRISF